MIQHLVLFAASTVMLSRAPAQDCRSATQRDALVACARQEYQKADQALNQLYRTVLSRLQTAQRAELRTVERQWLAYRNAHCNAAARMYEGGREEPVIRFACLEEVTEQRIELLKSAYGMVVDER
jgi:uncharacterized protein YecT (DUF1311 family)